MIGVRRRTDKPKRPQPIGVLIAQARGSVWSQEEYAEQLSVTPRTLQRWETLQAVPQPEAARRIGHVMGLENGALAATLEAQEKAVKERQVGQ